MRRQGFSLLELSVVLTIISIVIAGGLTLGSAKTQQIKVTNNYEEMQEVAQAISIFVNDHGCMPRPALGTALPGSAEYGREPTGTEECAGTGGTGLVYTGDIPFYALGLPDEYGSDDYNTRYTYAVMDTATEVISSSYAGGITVNDDAGNLINDKVTYVILSHGKSFKGGRSTKTGAIGTSCDIVEKDGENCDGDEVFVDGTFNDGVTPANLYDDILIWKTTSGIYAYGATGDVVSRYSALVPSAIIETTATNGGDFGGYSAMATWVDVNGCPAASNYKICAANDVVRYTQENGDNTLDGWVTGTANLDCAGWGNTTTNGSTWDSGRLFRTGCSSAKPVLCCQWN